MSSNTNMNEIAISSDLLNNFVKNDVVSPFIFTDPLTLRQLVILLMIYKYNIEGSTKFFSIFLKLQKPCISAIFNKFEKLGIIERFINPNNNKLIIVKKTKYGMEAMKKLLN